jgi:hydroxyacylglutathione hydrolase
MKKTLKIGILALSFLAVLVIIFFAWYGIKAKSEIKKMSPADTGQLTESVFTIKDTFVNLYLVKSGDNYVAIDAGTSVEGVKEGLSKLNISPDNIVAVFLTHTDSDHVKGLALFTRATIFLSKVEEKMITGEISRFFLFKNSILGRPYNVILDHQILNLLNLKVQGILVPGHTPGSMCYLVNDKYLFTGDALSLKGGIIAGFNEFFNMDTKTALQSMVNIANLPEAEYIFTAHYGFTDDYEDAVRKLKN